MRFAADLVQSGKSEEFEALKVGFLDRLWLRLGELGSGEAVLLAVPGNHDLNRALPQSGALDMLRLPGGFDAVAERFWRDAGCDYRLVVRAAFGAYSQWWEGETRRPRVTAGALPGDFACTLRAGEHHVGIVGLNTTFLQLAAGNHKERLAWHTTQVHQACGDVGDWCDRHKLRLLLTHQGPDWLSPAARKHGESEVAPAGRVAIHLFGHMHEPEQLWFRRGGNPDAVRLCQGASVFGMERWGEPPKETRIHGYSVGQVRFDEGPTLCLWPRLATRAIGRWHFVRQRQERPPASRQVARTRSPSVPGLPGPADRAAPRPGRAPPAAGARQPGERLPVGPPAALRAAGSAAPGVRGHRRQPPPRGARGIAGGCTPRPAAIPCC